MLRPTQEVKLMFTNVAIASLIDAGYVHMFQIKTASKKCGLHPGSNLFVETILYGGP